MTRFLPILFALTCGAQPMPDASAPPPNTNRYYLNIAWDACGPMTEVAYGTASKAYRFTNILAGNSGRISNLLYGQTYFFRTMPDCGQTDSEWRFPGVQPPVTNYPTLACAGTLLMSIGWKGTRFTVSNRTFALPQSMDVYWWSTSKISVLSASNNQVNYGKAMHRQ